MDKRRNQEYSFANRPLEVASDVNIAEVIASAREKGYPIPPDPNRSVARTLAFHGLKLIPSPIPDAATYIAGRIAYSQDGFPGFNYGAFVELDGGGSAFAKLRYGPVNTEKAYREGVLEDVAVGGLWREANVLDELALYGYECPKVFMYKPATGPGPSPEPDEAETLELLCMEGFTPEQGTTRYADQFTPQLGKMLADDIRTFARPIEETTLFEYEQRKLPLEILLERAKLKNDDDYSRVVSDTVVRYGYLDQPIVVHGDTWLNNIIVRHDGSDVMFVDWELAGPGYVGQDAGRTLWGLTLDRNWNFSEVSSSARAFIEQWCQGEGESTNLRFGIMFESLRWIADRMDLLSQPNIDEADRQRIEYEIEATKEHMLVLMREIA